MAEGILKTLEEVMDEAKRIALAERKVCIGGYHKHTSHVMDGTLQDVAEWYSIHSKFNDDMDTESDEYCHALETGDVYYFDGDLQEVALLSDKADDLLIYEVDDYYEAIQYADESIRLDVWVRVRINGGYTSLHIGTYNIDLYRDESKA